MTDPHTGDPESPRPPADPASRGFADPSPTWDRVHERFHEALELEDSERQAFLYRLEATDPALGREVRSLLAAHQASEGFLGDSPAARLGQAAAPGDRLGPYRIVEEIARGGMGVVYRATRDDQSFAKDVAIKLIDPGMRSDQILKRFFAERQILAMLEHPNIARLLDGGTAPDGSPYLVMEFVSGRPLLEYCDAKQLSVDERLALFLTVCDAVQFAHQRLVVHRDLKSENVLVGEDGSPRLLDFGIAKLIVPEGSGDEATRTAPMHRMLTPDYASPEQVRGEPVTVASDVYSLGVVLYELLTGARPLRFQTRTPEEILRVFSQEDPPLPSAVASRSMDGDTATRRRDTTRGLRRRLAGDLDYVVLKALEKDPARRYGSVDLLAQDLRRHLEGLPVLARGASSAYRLSRFVRRNRVAVIAGSLVALALLAGLAGTTWQAGVARLERDRATRRFNEVRSLARAVVFDLHDAIAPLPGSTRARELLVQHALRYLDNLSREAKSDRLLARELGVAYSKIADVQGRPMFPNLGRTGDALVSYQKALGLLDEAVKAMPESTLIVHDRIVVRQRLADLLGVLGRPADAMWQANEGRREILAQLALRPDDELFQVDLSISSDRMVNMKLAAGDTAGAVAECALHLSLAEKLFQANPQDPGCRRGALIAATEMAELYGARGYADSASRSYARAEKLAREAVAVLPNNTDAIRDLSIVYGAHALFLAERGQIDSSLAIYALGMKISEDLAAADPDNVLQQSDVAAGHYEAGTILLKARRHAAAESRFAEAYERFSRLSAADTGNAEFRTYVARCARKAGEASEALAIAATSSAERTRWRTGALGWHERSLALYRKLAGAGALTGEEVSAPDQVARRIAALKQAG